jgi:hypothetical protein
MADTDRGNLTCAGRPASGGHEMTDAQTFADWGVDYVKVPWVRIGNLSSKIIHFLVCLGGFMQCELVDTSRVPRVWRNAGCLECHGPTDVFFSLWLVVLVSLVDCIGTHEQTRSFTAFPSGVSVW